MNTSGILLVISGSSGVGKGTVCAELRLRDPNIAYSISATTRSMRAGEIPGVHYYFLSQPEFLAKIEGGEFLEWAKVYDNFYGTQKQAVVEQLAAGRDILLEIDTDGAFQVKKNLPESVLIFIKPPSRAELERRLRNRNTDSEEVIEKRLACFDAELQDAERYDYTVVNEDVERTVLEIEAIISKHRQQL